MASVFQRGKSRTWWIKYYVNGRQVYYSLNTKDARVAKKIKRQVEGEEAKGELLAPSRIPLLVRSAQLGTRNCAQKGATWVINSSVCYDAVNKILSAHP